MNFLKKIFGSKSESNPQEPQDSNLGSLPLDETFVNNFIQKGGKFLYCTDKDELLNNFRSISSEQNWESFKVYKNDLLNEEPFDINLEIKCDGNSNVFLSTCEFLIGKDGTILLSSNQIGECKISKLPENFIVLARTSQIVHNKRDALRGINWRAKSVKPTNISTIKYFDLEKLSDDILNNYGHSNSKNLYLLLLEDL